MAAGRGAALLDRQARVIHAFFPLRCRFCHRFVQRVGLSYFAHLALRRGHRWHLFVRSC